MQNNRGEIMIVFTYSEARQKLSSVLDLASKQGQVMIKRRDGRLFALLPNTAKQSPLDIKGIKTTANTQDIIDAVRESRQRPKKVL
jgi:PHD/YefM family antitoxin component YafN of YafNO toxin-antitoxin module